MIEVHPMPSSKLISLYRRIETTVVQSYRKIETTAVNGYTKIEDAFVSRYLIHEGETLSEAKARLKNQH